MLVLVVGFFAAWAAVYVTGSYQGKPYPYDTFLFKPSDPYSVAPDSPPPALVGDHRFGDFYDPWFNTNSGDPYRWWGTRPVGPSTYFPVTHTGLYPLMRLPYGAAFVVFLSLVLPLITWLVWAGLPRALSLPTRLLATFSLVALASPVLFAVDRGNIEPLLFLLVAAALIALNRGRHTIAALILALPIAMKGAAAVFLLPFALERRWRALAISLAAVVAGTVASLAAFHGPMQESIDGLRSGLSNVGATNGSGDVAAQHGISLKGVFIVAGHYQEKFNFFVQHYALVALLLGLVIGLACLVLPLRRWQILTGLVVFMLLAPSVSKDYRLMYLLLPLLLFLRDPKRTPLDWIYVSLFGLLLIPKPLPVLWDEVTVGAALNPLLLGVLGAVVIGEGVRRLREGEPGPLGSWLEERRGAKPS